MDGDQLTPLRAYLQCTLDYLDWLTGRAKLNWLAHSPDATAPIRRGDRAAPT